MKILVGVKRVVDYNIKVRVKSDGSGADTDHVKMSMNPFDEIAVEEAVRLKEAGKASQIIALSIGAQAAQDVLRTALAMGADRAILIDAPQGLESLAVAKILKEVVTQEGVDLILLGKQSIDDDAGQTGPMLAALLDCGQATFASKIEVKPPEKTIIVTREVDGGHQTLALTTPCVITTDLRLNEPRYVSLPNIMRARKVAIEQKSVADFNLDPSSRLRVLHVEEPMERQLGIRVNTVEELVETLRARDIL